MAIASPPAHRELSPAQVLPSHFDLFYCGAWHAPKSGRYVDTINPAIDEPLARVADAGADDADAAILAAHHAFEGWRALKPLQRGDMLRAAAKVLREHAEELAMLDALNTGNPVAEMVGDARVAATGIEYFAGLTTEIKGATIPMGPGNLNYTLREPLGVVARIVAYNHPLMFAAVKIGAPLAAGNDAVIWRLDGLPLDGRRAAGRGRCR
jgi:betaine-aldehyde dehydrogenase